MLACPVSVRQAKPSTRSMLHRRWRALAFLVLLWPGANIAQAAEALRNPEARDLSVPIRVGASEVFFPYEYRDADGKLTGFAKEVTDAVARAMGLRVELVPMAKTAMADALRTGRIDVIQFWAETEDRRRWADFSVPVARFETVAVVRKDDARIKRLADLAGKRVGVGQLGTVGWHYLRQEQPDATPILTETSEEFLRMLSSGKIDAAVMSRLTAASMIEHYGLRNLKVLDDRITGEAYDVRYCYIVHKGDALLLARLNEGLAIIHRTGEFDTIYRRWFGRYEARTFSPLELVSYVAAALALACAAVTWGLVRQRTLSRRVERQAAELAAQRSLLAALYDKHPLATVILEVAADQTGVLVAVNAEAIRQFGFNPAPKLPCPLAAAALADDVRVYLQDAVNRWRATGHPVQWEAVLPGSQRIVEAALVPLGTNEDGRHRICVLANDVTQRRLVEQELAHSRRLRALGELVGGIAHEFNNLLTPIIMTTSEAQAQRALPSALQANFAVIDNAARRAAELTKRLLTFGRKSDERVQAVFLRDTVENCFALLRSTMDRRIEASFDAPVPLPPLHWNPTDLNQIVLNLVINARDTLVEKLAGAHDPLWSPRLTVRIRELPADAFVRDQPHRSGAGRMAPATPPVAWQQLTIEDNGLGIAPEIIDRIFEPFFTTKDIGQGTGLGLATVWHLVTDIGGDIHVDSKIGEGTRFYVTLPRRDAPAQEATVIPGRGGPIAGRRGLRILLAEDDPLVARAALAILERASHTVTHCVDGSDAWARLSGAAAQYDVLLLDLNMPRLNGIDLIRRVRESPFRGAITVMSGRIAESERLELATLHVDRVLAKPFAATELLNALRVGAGS